jgi:type IV pilus assembly protein PilQ
VTLKFLDAKSLKGAVDRMSSAYGSIATDENTNSLIICDTQENIERIAAEIKAADSTPEQIMIEVMILDVRLQDDMEIGVDWDILSTDNYDVAYRQSTIFPKRLEIVPPTPENILNTSAYAPIGLGGEFSVISGTVRNLVHLLQQKRDVEILASPRVLVLSGQQAEIKTVEEIPYQEQTDTSAGGLLTSTEFKEVGVSLIVKATMTEEGKIVMEVKPKQSVDTGVTISEVPVVDTREATTTLLLDDGQIVVMGGLRRQETKLSRDQIPLLGDLPLIGWLFASDRKIVMNSELLVLISPHVYKGEKPSDEAMAKYKALRERPLLELPKEREGSLVDALDR